jgi:phosphotransacetylase
MTPTDVRLDALQTQMNLRFEAARDIANQQNLALREALVVAMSAAQLAIGKANENMETRFESVNEFRAALTDSAVRMISRSEVEVMVRGSSDKIDSVTSRLDRLQGQKRGVETSWGAVAMIVGILIALGVGVIDFTSRPVHDDSAAIAALSQRLTALQTTPPAK